MTHYWNSGRNSAYPVAVMGHLEIVQCRQHGADINQQSDDHGAVCAVYRHKPVGRIRTQRICDAYPRRGHARYRAVDEPDERVPLVAGHRDSVPQDGQAHGQYDGSARLPGESRTGVVG